MLWTEDYVVAWFGIEGSGFGARGLNPDMHIHQMS